VSHKLRPTITVPSHRPEQLAKFFEKWGDRFKGCRVIVAEDAPVRTCDVPDGVECYSWQEIDADLGEDAWIIPRRSADIRSYALLKAVEEPTSFIWALDNDCYPEPGVRYLPELERRLSAVYPRDRWFNTMYMHYPRGFPYSERKATSRCILHHGLWSHIPDFDGQTQLALPQYREPPHTFAHRVPYGMWFPMCSMHFAWRPEATVLVYQLPMGGAFPFARVGDIWSGLFAKKIADHLGYAVSSGAPSVRHERQSDATANAETEKAWLPINEGLWREVEAVRLTGTTFVACYRQMALAVRYLSHPYFITLAAAMEVWADLVEARCPST